jgi:hypothetical protein
LGSSELTQTCQDNHQSKKQAAWNQQSIEGKILVATVSEADFPETDKTSNPCHITAPGGNCQAENWH